VQTLLLDTKGDVSLHRVLLWK